jgi:uncharacterized protein (DUF433 family)
MAQSAFRFSAGTRKLGTMDPKGHISVDPAVLTGKPVIAGTRIAGEFIVDLLASGWTPQR